MNNNIYGEELIIDLHKCNRDKLNQGDISEFLNILCDKIKMQRVSKHFYDLKSEESDDQYAGISVIQFITTSSIIIHTYNKKGNLYLNVFSCKKFDRRTVLEFSSQFFEGEIATFELIRRI